VNPDEVRSALSLAQRIQKDVDESWLPPPEVQPSLRNAVVPAVLFKNSRRDYLISVVHQINTTYEHTCYDACAVMVRRLVESLIIEVFEAKQCAQEIKGPDDNFFYLSQLIPKIEAHSDWNLSRNAKNAFKRLKSVGDVSAHNRRYIATRHDIDDVISDIRVIVQELLTLAHLR
jgi:Domain of unknown function (DUF4145)